MKTVSIKEMHSRFCDTWRRGKTDAEFLDFMRALTCLEGQDHKHRREVIRDTLALHPGKVIYSISEDDYVTLVE